MHENQASEKIKSITLSSLNERNSAVTNGIRCIWLSNLRGNQKNTERVLDALFQKHESGLYVPGGISITFDRAEFPQGPHDQRPFRTTASSSGRKDFQNTGRREFQ